jgi:hypothetical protein
MITTYRITATTWATLALVALGFLPWWRTGALYATGFVLPVAVAVLVIPPKHGPPTSTVEPGWLLDSISRHVHAVYRVASILLLTNVAAFVVIALG